MNLVGTVSLEAVYTHSFCSLENKASIFPYALLKLHAKDG